MSARKRCAAGATAAWASVAPRPEPPKKPSSSASSRLGSTHTKAKPASGLNRTTATLAGSGRAACWSAAFTVSIDVNCMLASRPSNPAQRTGGALREGLAHDLEHRQLRAIDALRREVVGTHVAGAVLFQERGHLLVGDGIRRRRGARSSRHYCTTKLVNSRSSTSPPPCFFCTARTSARASSRSFSLPSRDISAW